jgi:cell division protein FtsB
MIKINTIFVLLILFSFNLLAQMTDEEYSSKKDSLTLQKKRLNREIETLYTEIDSMQQRITELEQEVITAFRELFILKYGEEVGNRVAYKRIWKGMTDENLRNGFTEM